MAKQIGDAFQRETKYDRREMGGMELDWASKPETFKRYPDAETVELPLPIEVPPMELWRALAERRSVRKYADEPMTLMQLSQLLWAAQGVTARKGEYLLRTAPSAGALYPVETYVVVNNVTAAAEEEASPPSPRPSPPAGGRGGKEEADGSEFDWPVEETASDENKVASGVYHYDVQNHRLECLKRGNFSRDVAAAACEQIMCVKASVVFLWTGVFERSKWKYGERAYRYVYLDAGHVAANVALAAVALGLGSCQIAALFDDECNALVGVDGTAESTVYMTSVGKT